MEGLPATEITFPLGYMQALHSELPSILSEYMPPRPSLPFHFGAYVIDVDLTVYAGCRGLPKDALTAEARSINTMRVNMRRRLCSSNLHSNIQRRQRSIEH